eukprot:360210-Chlamydomonas_euryale.AAC.9
MERFCLRSSYRRALNAVCAAHRSHLQHQPQLVVVVAAGEERLAQQHFSDDAAKRPDVDRGAVIRPHQHLRRAVPARDHVRGVRRNHVVGAHGARKAKVAQLDGAGARHEHVGRLAARAHTFQERRQQHAPDDAEGRGEGRGGNHWRVLAWDSFCSAVQHGARAASHVHHTAFHPLQHALAPASVRLLTASAPQCRTHRSLWMMLFECM